MSRRRRGSRPRARRCSLPATAAARRRRRSRTGARDDDLQLARSVGGGRGVVRRARHGRHARERLRAVAVRQRGPQVGARRVAQPDHQPVGVHHVRGAREQGRQAVQIVDAPQLRAESAAALRTGDTARASAADAGGAIGGGVSSRRLNPPGSASGATPGWGSASLSGACGTGGSTSSAITSARQRAGARHGHRFQPAPGRFRRVERLMFGETRVLDLPRGRGRRLAAFGEHDVGGHELLVRR